MYTGKCSIENCENTKILSRGLCQLHYHRWHRYGDPLAKVKERTKEERNTPEYRAWKNIKTRCSNDRLPYAQYYTGKGIKVCDRWMNSYYDFLSDMGRRPSNRHSIDRINNDGNYEPGNCRWATRSEQIINQGIRKDNTSGYKYIYPSQGKWIASIKRNGVRNYLGVYTTIGQAKEIIDNYLK